MIKVGIRPENYKRNLLGNSMTDREELKTDEPSNGHKTNNLYVTGGQQKNRIETDEWRQYGKGVIVRVSLDTDHAENCVEYVSPPEVCPEEEPSITFKSGALRGNKLYVCTSTEVLIYEVPTFKQTGYISLPCFNDLHHVYPTKEGNLLLANTGLDMVVEVTTDGEMLREWNVLGKNPWAQFSSKVDYRKVATTKPHKSHPNHVFKIGDQIWVTRFEQRDAVCLDSTDDRIKIDIQRPHDGTPYKGFIYFTTVDGHLVVANQQTLKVEEVINLRDSNGDGVLLGWCRGLKIVDQTKIWIGFSRFRPTKFRENISWIKNGFKAVRKPTHIALYDLVKKERIREINLEPAGINTVFSILPEPNSTFINNNGHDK